jgi:hypothetical protein
MPQVGFEPKIPVSQWAKTFDALDCAATVITLPFIPWCLLPKLPVLIKERFPYKIEKNIFDFTESRLMDLSSTTQTFSENFQKNEQKH